MRSELGTSRACRWRASAASTSTSRSSGRAGASRSAGADGLARVAALRRRGAAPVPPLGGDLARRDVPRPGAVQAAGGGAPAAAAGRGTRLSVWSAGCSDGAELHTLGLVLARMGVLERTVLLGSDLLEENLALARAGELSRRGCAARMRWERRDLAADGPPPGRWRLVAVPQRRDLPDPEARRRALRDARVGAGDARHPAARAAASGCSTRRRSGCGPAGPHAYERVRMRRRLTVRTLAVSALDHRRRRGRARRAGGGIDRQHDAGERARHSQAVIATANLTAAAAAGGPDDDPRLPDRREPEGPGRLPRGARVAAGRGARARRGSSADNPGQSRLAQEIRRQALAYVDTYADPVIERTREAGVGPGRAFAAANDGGAAREELAALIGASAVERGCPRQRAGRGQRVQPRAADRRARVRAVRAGARARHGVRRAADRDAGRPPRGGRVARPAGRARRDRPGARRRRDRPARRRLQRDGAGARAEPRRAREPEHGARDAGDRARGAPGGADRGRRRGSRAARRARALREPAGARRRRARSATASSPTGSAARATPATWPRSRSRRSPRRRAPTSACSTPRTGATTRAGRAPPCWRSTLRRWPSRARRGRGRGRAGGGHALGGRPSTRGAELRVRTGLGGETVVRWEVHVPLCTGERAMGVAALGGVSEAAFDAAEAPPCSGWRRRPRSR